MLRLGAGSYCAPVRRLIAALFTTMSVVTTSHVSAHGLDTPTTVVLVVVPLIDSAFMIGDAVAAVDDARSNFWLLPQAVFLAPQAALLGIERYDDEPFLPLGVSIVVAQLTAFPVYGLASPQVSTTALYGLSWGVGVNAALTNNAVALASRGKLASPIVAVSELAASVPQIAVAGFALHSPPDFPRQRAAVLALGAWSSALFVHGALSLAFYRPAPKQRSASHSAPPWSFTVAPGLVPSEMAAAPGLMVLGAF